MADTAGMHMEWAREFCKPLFLCFVNLKKAYDSVNCEPLWTVLQEKYHLPPKLIRISKALDEETQDVLTAYGWVSKEFLIRNAIHQGNVLAATLFNLFFFDAPIHMAMQNHPEHGLTVLCHPEAELVGSRK